MDEKFEVSEINNYFDIEFISMENLITWIDKNYYKKIPQDIIDNIDSFKYSGTLMIQIANDYSFLISLIAYTKTKVREFKRKGKDFKQNYEDLIDKRDYLEETLSALKLQKEAISRNVTIRQQIVDELKINKTM